MSIETINQILCDYLDALDCLQRHHRELLHCHGWKTAIADETLASVVWEFVRMGRELTSREFIEAMNATDETLQMEVGG